MNKNTKKYAGILMHISSLPADYGIGSLGKAAFDFVDFLCDSGQKYWQMLPIGPTSYGDSPYQVFSSYAGNPYFIDLDILNDIGLLQDSEYKNLDWYDKPESVDYKKIYDLRFIVLRKAYDRFKSRSNNAFDEFIIKEKYWLDDYALFMAVKNYFAMKPWPEWDDAIKFRKKESIDYYSKMFSDEISFFKWIQFIFYSQWGELQKYAKAKSISIIGDIPIYPSLDSVDVWVNPEVFCLDDKRLPRVVAGFPPDNFSKTGQLWGNPVYNWDYLKKTNYNWWIQRLKASFRFFDVLRIDHFRGFESYYTVPYKSKNAVNGKWVKGPGIDFFNKVKEEIPGAYIIAEDLGLVTKGVKKLLIKTGYPGMKVLEYAFDGNEDNEYLPHNYEENTVAFTGTHDNDTIMGWFNKLTDRQKKIVIDYVGIKDINNCNFDFIKIMYASASKFVIIPMQDILGIDSEARMNTPSTITGNWRWRARKSDFSGVISKKLKVLCEYYDRL